jgi:hypothetical protein
LLGVIDANEASALTAVRHIRNAFAHKYEVTLHSSEVIKYIEKLSDFAFGFLVLVNKDSGNALKPIVSYLKTFRESLEAAKLILNITITIFQVILDTRLRETVRIVTMRQNPFGNDAFKRYGVAS